MSAPKVLLVAEIRGLTQLALPVVAAQLGMMFLGTVDTAMVGHIQANALAAVALASTFNFAILILGQGVLHALDPVVAQAFGAKEYPAVRAAFGRGFVLSALLSIPYAAILWWSEPILTLLRQPPEVVALAAPFLRALMPGIPAAFAFVTVRQTLQAVGVVWPVLVSVVAGNLVNWIGNLALIHGRYGMPEMGVLGSAWSTTICRWLMLVVLVGCAWVPLRGLWPKWSLRLFEPRPLMRLCAIGIPIGIQIGLEMWVFTAAALLIGNMGARQLAAHQIAINLASLSFMVPLGVGSAAATRVGQAIGRQDLPGARRAALVALWTGGAIMLLAATMFWVMPRQLVTLFTADDELVAGATTLLGVAAWFQIFDGTQAVGCGILRGAADTRMGAVINFVGYWLLGLPLGLWLAHRRGMGAAGLWWGLTLGLLVVATLLVLRIRKRFTGPLGRVQTE